MKIRGQLIPSYIIVVALMVGFVGMVTFFSLLLREEHSDLIVVATIAIVYIFPYSLTGSVFGFLATGEPGSATVAMVATGAPIAALAVGTAWFSLWVNRRFGARAGYAMLAGVAILGPITFWLGNLATDCLGRTWAPQYCNWRPWWDVLGVLS